MKSLVYALPLSFALTTGGHAQTPLPADTLQGWQHYVQAVEGRRRAESARSEGALTDGRIWTHEDRQTVSAGGLVVRRADAAVEVDDATVHHWRGAVFLPGVTLDGLMQRLQNEAPPTSPDVLRSSVLRRGPSTIKVFLRLQRTKIVTAVYDTEHEVTFARHSPTRASSRSIATRIAEIDQPGTPRERERMPGDDRGFLWRLNAYWRYEVVPGGVVAECESISLSRSIPFGLGAIAGPIVRSTARESMTRTLESLRDMVRPIKSNDGAEALR